MSNLLLIVLFSLIGLQGLVVCLLVNLINKERFARKVSRKSEKQISRSFIKTLVNICEDTYLDKEDYKNAYEDCYKEYQEIFKVYKGTIQSYKDLDAKYDALLQFVFDTINTNSNGQRFSDDFKKLPTAKIIELFGNSYKAM